MIYECPSKLEEFEERIEKVKNTLNIQILNFNFENLKNLPLSLAIAKLSKIAKLQNRPLEEILNEYFEKFGLEEKNFNDLADHLMDQNINFQDLKFFQNHPKICAKIVCESDENLEKFVENSTWAHLMQEMKFQSYDKNIELKDDQEDFEMINFEKKLQGQMFKDKGMFFIFSERSERSDLLIRNFLPQT